MPNLEAGLLILNEWMPAFRSLSGDDCQKLLIALFERQQQGVPMPDFGNTPLGIYAQMIEPTIKRRIDGSRGGKKGISHAPIKDTSQVPMQVPTQVPMQGTSEASREEKSIYYTLSNERVNARTRTREKKFVPPTLEEVQKYCTERGNKIDAQRFIDHYTANGWMVGRNSMKDWKAAVRNWEKSEGAFARQERGNGVSATNSSFDVDDFFEAAVARTYKESRHDYS